MNLKRPTNFASILIVLSIKFTLNVCIAQAETEITYPPQLDSPYASEVLGLGNHDHLDQQMIVKAYRQLAQKFHPDRVADEKEKETYTRLFKIIIEAKKTLLDYVKLNPSYNPQTERNGTSSSKTDFGDQEMTWESLRKSHHERKSRRRSNPAAGQEVVPDDYYQGLKGTMFQGLMDLKDLTMAYLPLKGYSDRMGQTDMLLVIDPEIFPLIKVIHLQKVFDGAQNSVLQTHSEVVTYQRARHVNGSGSYSDAIVFADSTYLMVRPEMMNSNNFIFSTIDAGSVLIKMKYQPPGMVKMNSGGYSEGSIYTPHGQILQPEEIMPLRIVRPWDNVRIDGQRDIIRLGSSSGAGNRCLKAYK